MVVMAIAHIVVITLVGPPDGYDRFFARFFGTLAPAWRASLKPMAMACLRLVTFLPEPPERSVPRFRSCIARSTFFEAFFPYFAIDALPSSLLSQLHGECQ